MAQEAVDLFRLESDTELAVYKKLPVAFCRGEGVRVFDQDERAYLDLYGGHAVCLTGHCHPRVVDAIRAQAGALLFYSNATFLPVRARAAAALLRHAPADDMRVFFCNSGAEANEVAIKTARRTSGRAVVVSFEGSFHGRTLATLAACGIESYRRSAGPGLDRLPQRRIPWDDLAALDEAVRDDTACVLLEAIQSLRGVYEADPEYLAALRRISRERGAALIFDEVQTGLGRTGRWFYGDHFGITPDAITLAKGIGSGVPCGAVLFARSLWEKVSAGDHGSTFGGGPLAMAALEATVSVIEDEGLVENAAARGAHLREVLEAVPGVRAVRGRGLLLGLELDRPAKAVQTALLARGVVVGTATEPHTLRLLPPLVLSDADGDAFRDILAAALEETAALTT